MVHLRAKTCKYCGVSYVYGSGHVYSTHGKGIPWEKRRVFTCDICGAEYHRGDRHMSTVHGGGARKIQDPDRAAEMKALYDVGLNLSAIAEMHHISRERVRQIFASFGWPTRQPKKAPGESHDLRRHKPEANPERNADIVARYLAGEETVKQIAESHGMLVETIYPILRRHHVPLRRPFKGYLTPGEREMVRLRIEAGESYKSVATDYNVTTANVALIVRGETKGIIGTTKRTGKWRNL